MEVFVFALHKFGRVVIIVWDWWVGCRQNLALYLANRDVMSHGW